MRRVLLAALLTTAITGVASAADLRRAAPVATPMPAAYAYNWTGFYIGVHAGYGWGNTSQTVSTIPAQATNPNSAITFDNDGALLGGQIGFNYQIGNFVLGIEGDMSWADLSGNGVHRSNVTLLGNAAGVNFGYKTDYDWIATITGRVGVAFDRALVYVKGGAAFAEVNYGIGIPALAASWAADDTRTGWTVGAGVEYAIMQNWTAKIEYNYINFDKNTYTAPVVGLSGVSAANHIDHEIHAVKLGLNYRF